MDNVRGWMYNLVSSLLRLPPDYPHWVIPILGWDPDRWTALHCQDIKQSGVGYGIQHQGCRHGNAVLLSRPDKFGRARISGRLWKIARIFVILPGFL